MKTQIILETYRRSCNISEIAEAYSDYYYAHTRRPVKKVLNSNSLRSYVLDYLEGKGKDLIKLSIDKEVYLDTDGFISVDANVIKDKYETFIFSSSLIEKDENETLVQKYIYSNEKNKEDLSSVEYWSIAYNVIDFLRYYHLRK